MSNLHHSDTWHLRRYNLNLLRRLLVANEPWTAEALAQITTLSVSSCRNLLLEMLKNHEVVELSPAAPRGGRPARRFQYCGAVRHYVLAGLFVANGQKHCQIKIIDALGKSLQERDFILPSLDLDTLGAHLQDAMQQDEAITVIGLSYPGVIRDGKTKDWGDLPELFNCDLQGGLQQKLGLPIVIDNDMRLATWGYALNNQLQPANLAYIGFPPHTLPGSGAIVDGKLLHGTHGFAGEVLYIRDQSWDEQQRQISSPSGLADLIAAMLRPITALLDPERIVVAGVDIGETTQTLVKEHCQKMFRGELLPKLFFLPDYLADNAAGLLDLAREKFYTQSQL